MLRRPVVVLVALAALWPRILLAQSVDRPGEEARVGVAWVYDQKESNTGLTLATYTSLVAETSPKEIVTNVIFRGRNGSTLVVFDHDSSGDLAGLAPGQEGQSCDEERVSSGASHGALPPGCETRASRGRRGRLFRTCLA